MLGTSRDLIVLTADGNARHGVQAILQRPAALNIREIAVEYYVHPERDPGCLLRCQEFMRPQQTRFSFAMVLFDREGCGDTRSRQELENDVEAKLSANGWAGRNAVVVVDPEFDAWVWSPSPHVDAALGWEGRVPSLRTWLAASRHLSPGATKPVRPKEALEAALEIARKARSSARYAEIGGAVSLTGCVDAAFVKFTDTLRKAPGPYYRSLFSVRTA